MPNESLEQTILKLRERVAFLERANQSLGAERSRLLATFADVEQILGGLGGLTLAGAVAARIAKADRATDRARKPRRGDDPSRSFPRDTGVLSDDVFAELMAGV